MRTRYNEFFLKKPKPNAIVLDKIETIQINTEETNLTLRVYYPNNNSKQPVLIYFHGGGFVIRDNMDIYDYTCRLICKHTNCVIVAVDYRLAPEHPFPAAPNDCYNAVKWVYKNAETLNINREKMGVWGESCDNRLWCRRCGLCKSIISIFQF